MLHRDLRTQCILPWAFLLVLISALASAAQPPPPPGKLVELGGYYVHLHCTGKGQPTVVVENGFDEFSSDWWQVQRGIEKFTRVCTYDRSGYAWSTPGPMPRTYAQINLDLHRALEKAREACPLLLVGHSFGGPVARQYALSYPQDVAGLLFAESVGEAHRIVMGDKTARLVDFAAHKGIPAAHGAATHDDTPQAAAGSQGTSSIEPPFDRLPAAQQRARLWALSQPSLQAAEQSEREWSPEYLALWLAKNQRDSLGKLPVTVLAREEGGFAEGLDLTAAELEKERRQEQADLAALSSRGRLNYVASGHEIEIEAPKAVIEAVREMVTEFRQSHH
jgi:pimeloyl-ACP methyl ester carboxylesterase